MKTLGWRGRRTDRQTIFYWILLATTKDTIKTNTDVQTEVLQSLTKNLQQKILHVFLYFPDSAVS